MSQWTHVNGNILFDYLPIQHDVGFRKDLKKTLGRIVYFEDDDWETDLPCGSEGSIEYEIYKTGRGYNAAIWGNLRDYGTEDIQNIIEWFMNVITHKYPEPYHVRDAVLYIDVEYAAGKVLLFDWHEENKLLEVDTPKKKDFL